MERGDVVRAGGGLKDLRQASEVAPAIYDRNDQNEIVLWFELVKHKIRSDHQHAGALPDVIASGADTWKFL